VQFVAGIAVMGIAGFAWLALSAWLPSGAERCYLLVPPTFLGLVLTWPPFSWRRVTRAGRTLALSVGVTFLLAYALAACASGTVMLGADPWGELLCGSYFLLALGIVLVSIRWVVRGACNRLAAKTGNRWHGLLTEVLPLVVLTALYAPYLLGVAYVHRFKIVPQSSPLAILQRWYEDVEFRTQDDLTLRGWFVPAKKESPRTLLVCHGLGTNREDALGFLQVADRLQANALFFDFRGHGASDGHTVSLGVREKNDVLAAIAYLRTSRSAQARELIGLGVSMGCGALILAAAEMERPFQGLIIDSGMASALDLTDSILKLFPRAVRPWLAGLGIPIASLHAECSLEDLRPEEHIGRVRAPVLIVHSLNDRLIPPDHGQRLYDHAAAPKQIFLAHTHRHADVFGERHDEYLERVAGFLR